MAISPQGFSLLELLIAMSIMAVLMSMAYPHYQHHIRIANRRAAEMDLMAAATQLENYYDQHNNSYRQATMRNLGLKDSDHHYLFRFSQKTETHYVLQALPEGAQNRDSCGALWIDDSSRKGAALEHCWDE